MARKIPAATPLTGAECAIVIQDGKAVKTTVQDIASKAPTSAGPKGDTGPKGDAGAKGDQGPQGLKGDVGLQGQTARREIRAQPAPQVSKSVLIASLGLLSRRVLRQSRSIPPSRPFPIST